ncbi:MAG: phosphoribosyl-ATP diphosphatase [Erythrobacter sp.]
MNQPNDILARLEATIAARLAAAPQAGADKSYVASLHARGLGKIAQKVGEEATETIIAALAEGEAEVVSEAADLVFHLLVLLGAKGISLDQVLGELARREGLSGLDEKAARSE